MFAVDLREHLCPVCQGSPAGKPWTAPYASVLQCSNCSHLYAASPATGQGMPPMPDTQAELRLRSDQDRRLVRRWIDDGFVFPEVRVLDIGAGTGRLSQAILDQVPARISCLEPEAQARAHLRRRGFDVVETISEAGTVNAILLIEVIEHVEDPVGLLRACAAALAPSGRIFLTTPCGETTSGHRPMAGYRVPEHIQFFTERSLRLACTNAGLHRLDFFPQRLMRPPGRGADRLVSVAKSCLRVVRDAVQGRHHFACYVS